MTRRPRRNHSPAFNAKTAMENDFLESALTKPVLLRDMLRREGFLCGRRRVSTLMRRLGIEALCPKPNSSRRRPSHPVYPYLLRGLAVDLPNQVWAMDIVNSRSWRTRHPDGQGVRLPGGGHGLA